MWISSCSTFPFKSPEETLRTRVEEMMNAKINNDWDIVYKYLDSSYRKKTSEKAFLGINREIAYTNYSVQSIEVQPSKTDAMVIVKQDIKVKMFDFKDQSDKQHWIKEGFNWYLKVEK